MTIVAAVQMVSGTNLQDNLDQAAELIQRAADQGAKLVVLPEMFAMMKTSEQVRLGRQERESSALRNFLAAVAARHQIWLVAGSIPLASADLGDRVYACCPVFDPAGQCVAEYYKIHLFDVDVADSHGRYRESDTFQPGRQPVVIETPFGKLGIAICYDLRFPELFRVLFAQGAEIVAVPAAFTRFTGESHWLPLMQARSIENQCYMVGANQGGQHGPKRFTSGGSVVIDPWGRVLAEAARGQAVVSATMDRELIQRCRRDMPVSQHRKILFADEAERKN